MDHVLNGFLAALGVMAVVLPLIGGKRLEEREICFAHHAVQFDGFARIAFFVVSGNDPGVLIIGLNRCSGGSENGAHAPPHCDFDVGEVGENFGDRPLLGCWALAQFDGGNALDQASHLFVSRGLDFNRILSLGVGQDALRILFSGFGHWESPSTLCSLRVSSSSLNITKGPPLCISVSPVVRIYAANSTGHSAMAGGPDL